MGLLTTLFPWRRKADLEREVVGLRAALDYAAQRIPDLDRQVMDLEREIRLRKSISASDKRENQRLRDLLSNAHFRNPKTGRIGRKGQLFTQEGTTSE